MHTVAVSKADGEGICVSLYVDTVFTDNTFLTLLKDYPVVMQSMLV